MRLDEEGVQMSDDQHQPPLSARIRAMPRSNIHLMSALAMEVDDPVSLSWAKPASGTP